MYYCLQPAKLISLHNEMPPTAVKHVGSFLSRTKEIEKNLLLETHCGTYMYICEPAYICPFIAITEAHLDAAEASHPSMKGINYTSLLIEKGA